MPDHPPWLQRALGKYLRQCQKWADSHQLADIIRFYFGLDIPAQDAPTYAKALSQKLCPMGRPKKSSRQWVQLELL